MLLLSGFEFSVAKATLQSQMFICQSAVVVLLNLPTTMCVIFNYSIPPPLQYIPDFPEKKIVFTIKYSLPTSLPQSNYTITNVHSFIHLSITDTCHLVPNIIFVYFISYTLTFSHNHNQFLQIKASMVLLLFRCDSISRFCIVRPSVTNHFLKVTTIVFEQ